MDFSFSEEQLAAVEAARAVFSGVAPDSVPSPALTAGAVAEDFDRPLWRRLASADLLGLVLDETYGGAGLDPVALCLVLREAGAVLARVPLLETCAAALAVQADGPEELRARLLPAVGSGGLVLTVASAGRTGHDGAELAVTARPADGDPQGNAHANGDGTPHDWLLDGVQTAVPWAPHADHVLVPASAAGGRTVIAVVPREAVTAAEQISTSGERHAELRLDAVRVPAGDVITADGAWDRLRRLLTTGTCALALGLGGAVLRMTGAYTSRREQFGHPLATFQAVAVQSADRYIDLRAMEVTCWQAAWRLDPADVAVAKIWASEGVRRVVQTAQHLHGGFGADTDYPLHRYHAWAKQLELSLGPAAAHEEELGNLLAAEA
ncbi:acyl-CoA dehydrogenase family protein [Actinacidiphila glaucinigra]|uniref:acyl-CoA dehydrogenase family protein n=1 Tax=Actinacidiphila glaucinigra TaxID=235986 RepID=UPI00366A875F